MLKEITFNFFTRQTAVKKKKERERIYFFSQKRAAKKFSVLTVTPSVLTFCDIFLKSYLHFILSHWSELEKCVFFMKHNHCECGLINVL